MRADDGGGLTALGLNALEDAIYRALVGVHDSSAAELAGWLAEVGQPVSATEVVGTLDDLVGRGLVIGMERPDRRTLYRATPPALALEPLLAAARDDLATTAADIARLVEQYRANPPLPSGSPIEVVTGRDAVRHRFLQVQLGAREELVGFTPVLPTGAVVPVDDNRAEQEAMRRGVRIRVVLERGWLDSERFGRLVGEAAAAGQELYVVDSLPLQMVIADQRIAMVPVAGMGSGDPAAAIIQEPGLVAAFLAMWEVYQARGRPVSQVTPADVDGSPTAADASPDQVDRAILALLDLGLTDVNIARQLDMGARSVQRRLQRLMRLADARTRFQLAAHAVRTGWLEPPALV